jgi:penicillin-binding protein 1A
MRRQLFRRGDVIQVRVTKVDPGGKFHILALDQDPLVQGALLTLDVGSGHVLAMVGGYDFMKSQFNRATQALRQPGSSFKPLLYAAALEEGMTPASMVLDAPLTSGVLLQCSA